jgi:hypothetical protein
LVCHDETHELALSMPQNVARTRHSSAPSMSNMWAKKHTSHAWVRPLGRGGRLSACGSFRLTYFQESKGPRFEKFVVV